MDDFVKRPRHESCFKIITTAGGFVSALEIIAIFTAEPRPGRCLVLISRCVESSSNR